MTRALDSQPASTPVVVPLLAAASTAMRYQLGPGISICVIVALVLLPVWLPVLRQYRGARLIVLLGCAAAVWGVILTTLEPLRQTSMTLQISETLSFMAMIGGIGVLLWARQCVGTAWTATAFGFGALANVALAGVNSANPWKYSLAVPVAIIVLALANRYGGRMLELILLTVLAGFSAISDSRSFTSFLILAAALVLFQVRSRNPNTQRARPWQTMIWVGALGFAAYSMLQALILEGALGEAAAQRSQAQIDTSGSLITGGRPELGAAIALIRLQPWGFGSGVLPTSHDVWVAKSGMSDLNYNPNNGYVERFMFGGHFEVHSVLGDLWVRFGPLGAATALFLIGYAIYAVVGQIALRQASGVVLLLLVLGVWDTFFSPLLTSYRTLALLFALCAIPVATYTKKPAGEGSLPLASRTPRSN